MRIPFVIAEIGVNYFDTARVEGITPLDAAKKYIDKAKEAGVDAVKFQSYKAETISSKNSPAYWDITKESTLTQYELFKKYDKFNKTDYKELASYCESVGVKFMSTPFDYDSVDYLSELVDVYKISSSDLTNLPFIKYIAQIGKPIYLSVGASYLSEVEEAVRIIKEEGCKELCLLHCVLSYPCRAEDANLNIIKTLKRIFPELKVGYSDHTIPDNAMTILTTAFLLGAEVIEKHFTLDKCLSGNDHYHAGDPDDFKKAIANFKLITEIIGQEEKSVLPCELISRREARRSLVASKDLQKGNILKEGDIVSKRPGTGISPKFIDIFIGRELKYDINEDSIMTWDMI